MAVDLMARWFMDRRVWICQVMLIYLGYLAEVAAIVMALSYYSDLQMLQNLDILFNCFSPWFYPFHYIFLG